jgi:hypothetical protein
MRRYVTCAFIAVATLSAVILHEATRQPPGYPSDRRIPHTKEWYAAFSACVGRIVPGTEDSEKKLELAACTDKTDREILP